MYHFNWIKYWLKIKRLQMKKTSILNSSKTLWYFLSINYIFVVNFDKLLQIKSINKSVF